MFCGYWISFNVKINPGDEIEIEVDLALAHDGTGPKLLEAWEKQTKNVYDGSRVLLTFDHAFPAPTPAERIFQRRFSQFATVRGCVLYNHGERGITSNPSREGLSLSRNDYCGY